jgi:nucleotidyltransferase/DNA polymerase involved in DNA repair
MKAYDLTSSRAALPFFQVEELRNPKLRSKPLGVTQKYLIVTSNYAARSRGVTKLMGIKDAQAVCPEINLVRLHSCAQPLYHSLQNCVVTNQGPDNCCRYCL